VGKPEEQRPLARPRHRWHDNIKLEFKEIGWEGADYNNVAWDRHKWCFM
jgi:hypothetical protein